MSEPANILLSRSAECVLADVLRGEQQSHGPSFACDVAQGYLEACAVFLRDSIGPAGARQIMDRVARTVMAPRLIAVAEPDGAA